MPDVVRINITYEYTLPEGEERLRSYGTTDPQTCLDIDEKELKDNQGFDLAGMGLEPVSLKMELKDE